MIYVQMLGVAEPEGLFLSSLVKCSKTAHTKCCIQTTEVVTVVVTMIKLLFSGQLKCVSVSGIKDSGSQASTLSDLHRATQCTMCVAIISSHIILASFYFLSLCNAISSSISYHHHRPVSAVSYYVLCLKYIYIQTYYLNQFKVSVNIHSTFTSPRPTIESFFRGIVSHFWEICLCLFCKCAPHL